MSFLAPFNQDSGKSPMSFFRTNRPVERIPVSGFTPRGLAPRLLATWKLSSVWMGIFILGGMVPASLEAAEQEATDAHQNWK